MINDCICWVGHGDCGGCSGVPGIAHEPACGWEQQPNCPQHGWTPVRRGIVVDWVGNNWFGRAAYDRRGGYRLVDTVVANGAYL